jgi:hypothetical protein
MSEVEKCAFCGVGPEDRRSFVSGPAVRICDHCLGAAALAIATGKPAATAQERLEVFSRDVGRYCSFCGKAATEAKCLLYQPFCLTFGADREP